jgi:hypothetical protein
MSALTIELDSLTEKRLQQRSLQEGRKKEELAAKLLASSLAISTLSDVTEAQLLERINQGWDEATWARYHELVGLRKAESLTQAEHQELCTLTNQREIAHANRLRDVAELAKLRNVTLEEAMTQLGIGSRRVE